jgi:hypothetical protein
MSLKMIADASFRDASLLASGVYCMAPSALHKDGIIRVDSWEKLKKQLQSLTGVDHLVLYFHSGSGGLLIGSELRDFGTLPSFLGSMPRISEISLEGCNAGDNPRALAVLGRIFGVSKIHAFNYFHITQIVNVQIPKDAKSRMFVSEMKGIKEKLPFFARSQGSNLDSQGIDKILKGTPGTYTILAEWFREDYVETPPPPCKMGDTPPKGYKKRADAIETVLQDWPDLPEDDLSPVTEFQRVTIEFPMVSKDAPAKIGPK